MCKISSLILSAMLILGAEGAFAHHSFAVYDMQKDITLSGTVKDYQWTNPHSWLEVEVTGENGKAVEWALEMSSTINMMRGGWRPNTVAPGDKIRVIVHPRRDGMPGGSVMSAVLAGGEEIGMVGGAAGNRQEDTFDISTLSANAADTAGQPNLSGLWEHPQRSMVRQPVDDAPPGVLGNDDYDNPILQPWVADRVKEIHDKLESGQNVFFAQQLCMPVGVPNVANITPYSIQILQQPDMVTILYEYDHEYRIIRMNEELPEDPEPKWMGHSTAHWDDDTLVIETIGFNDKAELDNYGTPHTDQLRVTERFRLIKNGEVLEMRYTIDDPGAFTQAWTMQTIFTRKPTPLLEHVCAENQRLE